MKFPWKKYEELPVNTRNTIQIFITNRCNIGCEGCFARNVMGNNEQDITLEEYEEVIKEFVTKGGKQVNLLGGEPFLHNDFTTIIKMNRYYGLKTTVYTNGKFLNHYTSKQLEGAKIRVSIYSYKPDSIEDPEGSKSCLKIPEGRDFEGNFMVSSKTTLSELINSANRCEYLYGCKVFFISSLRELDNDRREFFDDTPLTMPVVDYKKLVHAFLEAYEGDMEIHVSKRGVFESTLDKPLNTCRFSNYFIGGSIIQCPFDIVNLKYQDDYNFNSRYCNHNNTCLMSKVVYRRK